MRVARFECSFTDRMADPGDSACGGFPRRDWALQNGGVTRFVIDPLAAIRLGSEGLAVAGEHRLVAPTLLRSDVLALLYRSVRQGELSRNEGRAVLDRVTTMRIRLLGDRVSRATAWAIAEEHGWDGTAQAEYLAVARLQADALVTLQTEWAQRAEGIVPLAPFEALLTP